MKVFQSALFLAFAPSVVWANGDCPACPVPCAYGWYGGKRQLATDPQFETCADFDYTVSVTVEDGHIMLAAEPQCGSLRNNKDCKACGGYVFHTSNMEGGSDELVKQVFEIPEDKEDAERLPLTTMTLGSLLQAFDDTPVSNNKFSFFKNNCASFVIDLGKKIGVNPKDPAIVKFVSRKLSEKSNVMEELSGHEEGRAFIDGRGDQDAVIEDFVSKYIHARV